MDFLDMILEFLGGPTIPMACPSLNREITGYYERGGEVKWRYTLASDPTTPVPHRTGNKEGK